MRTVRRIIHGLLIKLKFVRQRNSANKHKGIFICGRVLHSISKESNIQIDGIMPFNLMAMDCKSSQYEIGRIQIEKDATMICGKGVSFHAGCKLAVHSGAHLVIGDNIYFNMNTTLYCRNRISIGSGTIVSQNVVIRDSDVHRIVGVVNNAPISIGNHCWIGTNVIILKGVTIGDNSVIGAGSVVTHDIPADCVAAGNPAKVIKCGIKWEG